MDGQLRDEQEHHEPATRYLGVDGGGSKTLAIIVDGAGVECGRGEAGSSNHQAVGVEQAVAHLRQAIESAASASACSLPVAAAWIGLAGVDHAGDIALLLPYLQTVGDRLRLTNDAELVLSGLTQQTGVALIAGTGSIALGRNETGRSARSGGWGHIFGDEGSGYDLGCQALRAVARAADGRGKPTALLHAILDFWGLAEPELLLERVYQKSQKSPIARLAPLVLRQAAAGDAVARAITLRAARELALAGLTVTRTLDMADSPLSLALGGGLLVHDAYYRAAVLSRFELWQPLASVTIIEEPALSAARAAGAE